ncbi:MAG: septation ring formation regulator EzrA [Merdibacter sp.]
MEGRKNSSKKFSLFEEWMFASEFDKAHEQLMEISADIEELTDQLHVLPSLYEQARGVLPRAIDEIGLRYAQTRNKGVYLEHLDVQKNLDIISDQLKDNLNRLRNGSLTDVKDNLDAMESGSSALQELDRPRGSGL